MEKPPRENPAIPAMAEMKRELETRLLKAIPPGSTVWVVDVPVCINPGEWLITWATETFFAAHGIRVHRRFSEWNFPFRARIPADHILVVNGGGSLGDIYPQKLEFKLELVRRFPGQRIVILPQTAHFDREDRLQRTRDLFSAHERLLVMLRDAVSFRLFGERFPDTEACLVPDIAHMLWPLPRAAAPDREVLFLLRQDRERKSVQPLPPAGVFAADWLDLLTGREVGCVRAVKVALPLDRLTGGWQPVQAAWHRFAVATSRRLMGQFSRFQRIISSRLHGHLLACLLEIPNVVLDNSYGKNGAYFQTWTNRVPGATFGSPDTPAAAENKPL